MSDVLREAGGQAVGNRPQFTSPLIACLWLDLAGIQPVARVGVSFSCRYRVAGSGAGVAGRRPPSSIWKRTGSGYRWQSAPSGSK